jgi:hypothetical protein
LIGGFYLHNLTEHDPNFKHTRWGVGLVVGIVDEHGTRVIS